MESSSQLLHSHLYSFLIDKGCIIIQTQIPFILTIIKVYIICLITIIRLTPNQTIIFKDLNFSSTLVTPTTLGSLRTNCTLNTSRKFVFRLANISNYMFHINISRTLMFNKIFPKLSCIYIQLDGSISSNRLRTIVCPPQSNFNITF